MSDFNQDPMMDSKIRKFIRDTGMPLKEFAGAAEVSKSETLHWWMNEDHTLNLKNFEALAQYVGVQLDSLIGEAPPLDLIRKRIYGEITALPEQYSRNAHSFVRTSAHIIGYLSMAYGRRFTDQLLLSMNIHPLFFEDLNNKINLNFFIDLFNGLHRMGISDREIASLACYIFLRIRKSDMADKFRGIENHRDFYEVLAVNAPYLMESNFEYSICGSKDVLRVVAKPTEANLFLEKRSDNEIRRFFLYRQNVFNWFPTLAGLSPISMTVKEGPSLSSSSLTYEAHLSDHQGPAKLFAMY